MTNIIFIAGGGALGAILRYYMSTGIHNAMGQGFPYGTISVNLLGSIAIGIIYILTQQKFQLSLELKAGIMIGILGAFTTFSTFSLETITLLESGYAIKAVLNILLSVVLCIGGCWAGILVGRNLI